MLSFEGISRERVRVVEMSIFRWICGYTRKDKIQNDCVQGDINVTPIEEKMTKKNG